MNIQYSAVRLTNVIFWDNSAINNGSEIFYQGGDPIVFYSLIEGCGGSGGGWDSFFGTDGGHNLDDNPLFVNAIGGDLHLTQASPAIDSGDNNAPNLPFFDLDGNARISNGVVDMGAYEFEIDVSGVDNTVGNTIPLIKRLYGAFPNPFNPKTTIKFDLPKSERVSLRIYDVSGRLVRILVNGDLIDAGQQEAVWQGRDEAGRLVSAGVYFYRLEAGQFIDTKRMTLLK